MQSFFAAGGSAPRPPKHFPIANFWLRAWCFYCCYVTLCKPILRLAGVYGFPQAALSLNKFAHPRSKAKKLFSSELYHKQTKREYIFALFSLIKQT